jgi:hypothetical protein
MIDSLPLEVFVKALTMARNNEIIPGHGEFG